MKFLKFFFIAFVYLTFFLNFSFSEPVKNSNILIQGNKKISSDTIIELLDLKNNLADSNELNEYQKKLFKSNFFSSVDISLNNKKILINLIENPIIDYIFIEGIKSDKLLNEIKDELNSKENTLFSESLLNSDLSKITKLLSSRGYFESNVEYQVVKPKSDKVNIFFNIALNKKFSTNKIFFIGDKKIKSSKLLSVITSSPKSLFSFFSSSSTPSSERISYDISLLKKYYLNRGFYNIQIPSGSIEVIDKSSANIIFTIDAGQKFLIKDVNLKDNSNILSNANVLSIQDFLDPVKNRSYNLDFLKKIQNKISKYIDENNINANIAYNIQQLDISNLAISFEINEILKKTYIRNVKIIGNEISEDKVLLNNIYFAEGDIFSNLKISKSIDKLKSTGFFKDVNIKKKNIENSDNIDLEIKVTESPTGEIGAGVGVGTNSTDISFNFKEKNLLGKGLGLNLVASIGTETTSVSASLIDPDFANSGNMLKTSFFVSRYENDTSGYENKTIGSNISTGFEWYEDINLSYGISVDIDDLTPANDASALIKSRGGEFFTNKFFYSAMKDKRDKKFEPESGYTIGFGQDIAYLGSDIPFLSNSFFGSFHNKFNELFVGTIRYKIKSINTFESSKDIKLSDRLFLSSNELRGFKYKSFGPKVENDFVGGNYAYASSFSSTVPNYLPESWNSSSNIFLDVGNLWGSDFTGTTDSDKLRSSVGVGFSWFSPVGPLSITYAEPIQKTATDKLEKFNFKLGGVF